MIQQLEASPDMEAPAWQNATIPEQQAAPAVAHLLDVPMHAEVMLGTLQMKVRAISSLQVGAILRTTRPAGEPLDLLVNSSLVAAAEVCPQGEKLGLRVVELHGDN